MHDTAHTMNMMMASVEDSDTIDTVIAEAGISGMLTFIFIVQFATIALTIGIAVCRQFAIPSLIKNETITVSELYNRIQTIKPEECEKTLNDLVAEMKKDAEKSAGKDDDKWLLDYINSYQRLISAYSKFKHAEIDYYCRLLIEAHDKLSIANTKK